jgi:hypothetical protein
VLDFRNVTLGAGGGNSVYGLTPQYCNYMVLEHRGMPDVFGEYSNPLVWIIMRVSASISTPPANGGHSASLLVYTSALAPLIDYFETKFIRRSAAEYNSRFAVGSGTWQRLFSNSAVTATSTVSAVMTSSLSIKNDSDSVIWSLTTSNAISSGSALFDIDYILPRDF